MAASQVSRGLGKIKPIGVGYPSSTKDVMAGMMQSWQKFCDLPLEMKQRFVYTEDMHGADGIGYEMKDIPGPTLDRKENFHVALRAVEQFTKITQELATPAATEFIDNVRRVVQMVTPLIQRFAEQIESDFLLPNFADRVMENRDGWIFRYLHYFPNGIPARQIAAPHSDKSAITLHLFETESGLEYFDENRVWQPMPVGGQETVIIAGMQLQLVAMNAIRALYHRVMTTEDSAVEGRYSAVCFVTAARTRVYNKTRAGRLQDFPVAFNYDISFSEFSSFFTRLE